MKWKIEKIKDLNGFTIEWLDPKIVLFSKRNRIYRSKDPFGKREFVGEVSAPAWQKFVSRIRMGQRFLRFMAYNVIPLSDASIFVSFNKSIGIISKEGYRDIGGIKRPHRILRNACAVSSEGDLYWGEYIDNQDRGQISIYRYTPGRNNAEEVYTFEKGEVRHIHGIYADPYTGSLWCTSGDLPHECRIIKSDDGFKTIKNVGGGDETWRAVSILFSPNFIYFANDAEFRQNHIYRLNRTTGERTLLGDIQGPVYYSTSLDDDLLFAVTAELCPSQQEKAAVLYGLEQNSNIESIVSYRKDLIAKSFLVKLFLPGTLSFPSGPGT